MLLVIPVNGGYVRRGYPLQYGLNWWGITSTNINSSLTYNVAATIAIKPSTNNPRPQNQDFGIHVLITPWSTGK